MKIKLLFLSIFLSGMLPAFAGVSIDEEALGKSLGGWKKLKGTAAEYPLSGADYRTYKPEISPSPDGGIFISIRIDHVRGWLASDDHAVLEISVSSKGAITSAQSSIAIQGRSIKSDVILGGNEAGKAILSPEGAVQIGTDLVADLSAKLLRENIVEAGRVSFPSVLRHNYNRLFQAIRVEVSAVEVATPIAGADVVVPPTPPTTPPVSVIPPTPVPAPSAAPATTPALPPAAPSSPGTLPLEIKPFN